ncbi:MAG: hypothetical protein ACE5OV_03250 [Candidatus Bathyarchaeia archaeon]
MKRPIAAAGIFLTVVGSLFLILGTWYAWMYGNATNIRIWSLLFPGAGGDLLSFISLSSSMIVLGIIFIVWAYKLPNQFRNRKNRKTEA